MSHKLTNLIILFILAVLPLVVRANTVKVEQRFAVTNELIDNEQKGQFTRIYDHKFKRNRMVKDEFIIKFKKTANRGEINYYLRQRNLKMITELRENVYLCKPIENQSVKFITVLNKIESKAFEDSTEMEGELVEFFDINEYRRININSLDTQRITSKEWHLKNNGVNGFTKGADINVEPAWEFTKGEGIKVAVIDTGFDTEHKDINYAKVGFNALIDIEEDSEININILNTEDAKAPIYSNENHGTAVAGVIAAKDNNVGVVGVAPESEVVPIRLIDDMGMASVAQIVTAFHVADQLGVQIINNSWGSYDPSLPDDAILELSDLEKSLYTDIATNGNSGKGILIIFASGNNGKRNFNNSPEARLPETLAIGATDSTDLRASYSTYGDELDLVAPGGGGLQAIFTTDRRDIQTEKNKRVIRGYSKGSITGTFKGTSAAAPVVAGVAALIWSINPEYTAEQIKNILIRTAKKDLHPQYSFDTNGKNEELGYGRVDAGAAVEYARQNF